MSDLRDAVAETVAGHQAVAGHQTESAEHTETLRVLRDDEHGVVLDLLDDAVAWLGRRGITEQWGGEPFSSDPARVDQAKSWVGSGGAVVSEVDGVPTGALVLGSAPAYVPESDCPEVYVVLLVAARHAAARGAGRRLLAVAEQVARRLEVNRLRVDCFGGGEGDLVRYYEGAGFTQIGNFLHRGTWPGRVLERRLRPRG